MGYLPINFKYLPVFLQFCSTVQYKGSISAYSPPIICFSPSHDLELILASGLGSGKVTSTNEWMNG